MMKIVLGASKGFDLQARGQSIVCVCVCVCVVISKFTDGMKKIVIES